MQSAQDSYLPVEYVEEFKDHVKYVARISFQLIYSISGVVEWTLACDTNIDKFSCEGHRSALNTFSPYFLSSVLSHQYRCIYSIKKLPLAADSDSIREIQSLPL